MNIKLNMLHTDAETERTADLINKLEECERRRIAASNIMQDLEDENTRLKKELSIHGNDTFEQLVAQRTAELEAINNELEAFTYSVSHDLQAPMRHISGFNNIVLSKYKDQLPEGAIGYLQKINESVSNMNDLIEGLLTLSRVGRREMNTGYVDLNTVIDEVRHDLEPDMEERDIEWQIDKLPGVMCDPDMIKIVVTNLLSNAVKFTGKKEHAVISVSPLSKGKSGFIIRDNGVGFDMKNHDNIFTVFARLHTKDDFEGTGVGLATVYRIMAKHEGRVWAEAEVDKGATFYVELPVEQNPPVGRKNGVII